MSDLEYARFYVHCWFNSEEMDPFDEFASQMFNLMMESTEIKV